MDIKILLQAVNQPWFITPEGAESYALMLHQLITGQISAEMFEKPVKEFAFIANAAGNRIGSMQDSVDNGVAVINIRGAIMKYDYCGSPGTQSMMKAIHQANDNPSISAIMLNIDSPGGSVDGTQQLANAVKSSSKPVDAYINGMMCSAAMWIGSSAGTRTASSNTDVIGSIGTMASWNDFSGYMEKLGIKKHEVYATDSTHKNIQFREANGNNADGKPNYESLIKTWLDPLNNEFTSAIQQNLPNADKTVLNGSHFIATDAKKKGLIDKVGTFEQAVKSALQKGKQQQQLKSSNKMAFQKTLTAAKSESFEVVEGGFLLQEGQLNNIEASIALAETAATELGTAQAAVTRLTGELSTANTELIDVQGKLTTAEAEVLRLGALGGNPSSTHKAEDVFEAKDTDPMEFDFQKAILNRINS